MDGYDDRPVSDDLEVKLQFDLSGLGELIQDRRIVRKVDFSSISRLYVDPLCGTAYAEAMRTAMEQPPSEPKLDPYIDMDTSGAETRIQAQIDLGWIRGDSPLAAWSDFTMRSWPREESPLSPGAVTRRLFPDQRSTITGRLPRHNWPLPHMPRATEEKIMKSPEMQKFVDGIQSMITGGDTTNQAVFESRCIRPPVGCGGPLPKKNSFPSEVYEREYRITGMCTSCQDKFEAAGEDFIMGEKTTENYPECSYGGRCAPDNCSGPCGNSGW